MAAWLLDSLWIMMRPAGAKDTPAETSSEDASFAYGPFASILKFQHLEYIERCLFLMSDSTLIVNACTDR